MGITQGTEEMHISAVVSEVNFVGGNSMDWWVDTGATRHICANKWMFKTYQPLTNEVCYMGNSAVAKVAGKGTVALKLTSGKELTLTEVLHVTEIRKNLISGSMLNKKGFRQCFEADKFILTKDGSYIGQGYFCDNLFKMVATTVIPGTEPYGANVTEASTSSDGKNVAQEANEYVKFAYLPNSFNLWHGRLGHVNRKSLQKLISLDLLPKFNIDKQYKCETCVEAKLATASFRSIERSSEPLDLVHTDVCDLKYVQSRGGKSYFITFIDDCTRYCYVYLMRSKDEAIDMFVHYKNEVENQLGKKIKMLRSDRGGEYESPFAQLCAENGIIHQTTAPYSPQQNGIAERKNRTLKEMMNSLLLGSGAPQNFWGEALLSSNYILNRLPHKKLDKTPYELWKGHAPSYKFLKVWWCLAKVPIPPPKRTRIGPKTVDCVFIGYAQDSSAYRFLIHNSDNFEMHINTIIEARDASFFEGTFPYIDRSTIIDSKINKEATNVGEANPQKEVEEPRRSKRARTAKTFGPDFLTYMVDKDPISYKEAISSADSDLWKEAIDSEMNSILQNHTWELVDLPPGSKPLGHKWIFKRKMKPDGSVDKYKARLVSKQRVLTTLTRMLLYLERHPLD